MCYHFPHNDSDNHFTFKNIYIYLYILVTFTLCFFLRNNIGVKKHEHWIIFVKFGVDTLYHYIQNEQIKTLATPALPK